MGNLIKMDFYRMFKSRSFILSSILLFLMAIAARVFTMLANNVSRMAAGDNEEMLAAIKEAENAHTLFCSLIENPFMLFGSIIVLLISAVIFSYADIANGYIKNIAGQVTKKGYTVVSKFVVLAVHNAVLMLVGVVGNILINLPTAKIDYDWNHLPMAIGVFFIKWLLVMSLSSIILFITTGLKNKTLASVVGVILGSGTLAIVHMMLDNQVQNIMKVNLSDYDPSMLLSNTNILVVNSIVVSIVVVIIFLPLTIKIFNKTDVK